MKEGLQKRQVLQWKTLQAFESMEEPGSNPNELKMQLHSQIHDISG